MSQLLNRISGQCTLPRAAAPLTMVPAETTGTSTIQYLHGWDVVAQSDGVSAEHFDYDGLGSVRQVLESSASVLMAQTFAPYSNSLRSPGPPSR